MSTSMAPQSEVKPRWTNWIMPIFLLTGAYGLLGLTFTENLPHSELMERCVLMDPKLARVWSVGNVEIGLGYFGVFFGMLFYFMRLYRRSRQHLTDLTLAVLYLVFSFTLDYICVRSFSPFVAMLIGDACVMSFTLAVSRQTWFQRLLGVFVPIIFLTCGLGHLLEGLSYWHLTYPVNTPWTMVTADVGFAVLVNSGRYPAFIRGEDIVAELAVEKTKKEALEREIEARIIAEEALRKSEAQLRIESERRLRLTRDVISAVTDGRMRLFQNPRDLPLPLSDNARPHALTRESISGIRQTIKEHAEQASFVSGRIDDLVTAASEAMMNAIVHGGDASAAVSSNQDQVQVRVTDGGQGIDWEVLPQATLRGGWSSKGTLGMGFTLILETIDHMDLYTSSTGTTIVLTMDRIRRPPSRFEMDNVSNI